MAASGCINLHTQCAEKYKYKMFKPTVSTNY